MLTLLFADPTITAGGAPASPKAGQYVIMTVTVANTGGSPGTFNLSAVLVRADDDTTVEQYFFLQPGAQGGQVASGTVQPGQSTTVTMYSGPIASQDKFVPPLMALNIHLTLVDMVTGQQTLYTVQNAVAVPPAPENLSISSVNMGVGG